LWGQANGRNHGATTTAVSTAPAPARARRYAAAASALVLLLAAALLVRLLAIANPVERGTELPSTIALVAAYAVPGLLGVLSLRGRPALALAGGVLGLPLGVTAMSGVSLVLWIPSFLLLASYAAWRERPPTRAPAAVIAITAFVLGTGAFAANVSEHRTVCWTFVTYTDGHSTYARAAPNSRIGGFIAPGVAQSGMGCADAGTTKGAVIALGLVGGALGACWWLSGPPRQSTRLRAVTTNVS
jgi:hypothetical protein